MIMADKIIALRKKSGWSQEELAETLGVSRQSISKWEGAQAMPDMSRILKMSEVFGVSTDYLLKDEIEIADGPVSPESPAKGDIAVARAVSMEEASAYLAQKSALAPRVALAAALCVLSPVALIVLGSIAEETTRFGITEEVAAGVGLIVLLVLVSVAVASFMTARSRLERYDYIEEEPIDTAYGVAGLARERRESFRQARTRMLIAGVTLCILAVVPVFVSLIVGYGGVYTALAVALLLALVAAGVYLLTRSGIIWGSYQALLEEGDYSRPEKAKSGSLGRIASIYWLAVVAVYLAYSLPTSDWGNSWVVWPVAGVVFAIVMIVANTVADRRRPS